MKQGRGLVHFKRVATVHRIIRPCEKVTLEARPKKDEECLMISRGFIQRKQQVQRAEVGVSLACLRDRKEANEAGQAKERLVRDKIKRYRV